MYGYTLSLFTITATTLIEQGASTASSSTNGQSSSSSTTITPVSDFSGATFVGVAMANDYSVTGLGVREWRHWPLTFSQVLPRNLSLSLSLSRRDVAGAASGDPMMFLRQSAPAAKSGAASFTYTAFDAASWRAGSSTQTIVLGVEEGLSDGDWYLSVFNWGRGVWGPATFDVSLRVSEAAQTLSISPPAPPPTLGSAACSFGYYGARCEQAAIALSPSSGGWHTGAVPLVPGAFGYFFVDVNASEFHLELEVLHSISVVPRLFTRHDALPTLDASGYTDHRAFASRATHHSIRVANREMANGRWFIGVHNDAAAGATAELEYKVRVVYPSATGEPVAVCATSSAATAGSTESLSLNCPDGGRIVSITKTDFFTVFDDPATAALRSSCNSDRSWLLCHAACQPAVPLAVGSPSLILTDVNATCGGSTLKTGACARLFGSDLVRSYRLVVHAQCSQPNAAELCVDGADGTCAGNGRCSLVNDRAVCSCATSTDGRRWTGSDCNTPLQSGAVDQVLVFSGRSAQTGARSQPEEDVSAVALRSTRRVPVTAQLIGLTTQQQTHGLETDQTFSEARQQAFVVIFASLLDSPAATCSLSGLTDASQPTRRRLQTIANLTESESDSAQLASIQPGSSLGVSFTVLVSASDDAAAAAIAAAASELAGNPSLLANALRAEALFASLNGVAVSVGAVEALPAAPPTPMPVNLPPSPPMMPLESPPTAPPSAAAAATRSDGGLVAGITLGVLLSLIAFAAAAVYVHHRKYQNADALRLGEAPSQQLTLQYKDAHQDSSASKRKPSAAVLTELSSVRRVSNVI